MFNPTDFLSDTKVVPVKEEVKKKKPGSPPMEKKYCLKCDKVYALDKFYTNTLWKEQKGRDAWCKECAKNHCYNEETIREYCFYNNRRYSPSYFEDAKLKAKYYLNSDKEYLNPRTTRRRRDEMLDKAGAMQFFSLMNLQPYYAYFDNVRSDVPIPKFDTDSLAGQKIIPTETDDDVLVYDKDWFGWYTKAEITYLNTFFSDLQESFDISDPSRIDYARKMCRASLEADKAFNAYREGTGDRVAWEKALSTYDMLSKSAAFAASSKKKDTNPALDSIESLAELILAIEQTGQLLPVSPDHFTPDNVDMVYQQMMHTMKAIKGTE